MSHRNETTEAGRPPYMRKGYYEKLFWHMYPTASPKFKKRMDKQKALDEQDLKMIDNHYPNARK